MDITVGEFVKLLWDKFPVKKTVSTDANNNLKDELAILKYGHIAGWLEDQDEVYSTSFLDKRTAARIIHQFMKIELCIPDLEEIKAAEILQDLYTCRVCANHIAQVYLRNIMYKEEVLINGQQICIFNSSRMVMKDEVENILKQLSYIYEKLST